MSRQYWEETLAWATADGATIATTASETIIFPDVTIPAWFMADGRVLRLRAWGRYGSTATPTLTFRVRWGGVAGTVLAASGAVTVGATVTAGIWNLEAIIQTRANGASGSLFAMGLANVADDAVQAVGSATNAPAQSFLGSAGVATPAAVTADLTIDKLLSLTAQWGTSSASNTLTGHIYTVEALN